MQDAFDFHVAEKFLKATNDKMQTGYRHSEQNDDLRACEIWLETWKDIVSAIQHNELDCGELFDIGFPISVSIYDWACDFEAGLVHLSLTDRGWMQAAMDFCTEFTGLFPYPDDIIVLKFRNTIGDCLFNLGKDGEGEAYYSALMEGEPQWVWGWLRWSDNYFYPAEGLKRDYSRAVNILEQGLKLVRTEDIPDILERLAIISHEAGESNRASEYDALYIEAFKQAEQIRKEQVVSGMAEMIKSFESKPESHPPITVVKIGRNDPCPCGSGKKYKKCCGG